MPKFPIKFPIKYDPNSSGWCPAIVDATGKVLLVLNKAVTEVTGATEFVEELVESYNKQHDPSERDE